MLSKLITKPPKTGKKMLKRHDFDVYISTVKSTAFCGRYRTHTALQNQAKTKENYHQNGGNL